MHDVENQPKLSAPAEQRCAWAGQALGGKPAGGTRP